ncbi:MAG TPA: hypothetical protein VF595_14510 [Tepidisphaeraceae bacterium]|jgi:hypothetical protein
MKIDIVEFVMEWIVPIVGAMLTVVLIRSTGLQSGWWLLLGLPGALIFQWTVTLLFVGIASPTARRPLRNDG